MSYRLDQIWMSDLIDLDKWYCTTEHDDQYFIEMRCVVPDCGPDKSSIEVIKRIESALYFKGFKAIGLYLTEGMMNRVISQSYERFITRETSHGTMRVCGVPVIGIVKDWEYENPSPTDGNAPPMGGK